jgi:predicted aldo/keto reductase-like oxidoreductase
MKEVFVYLITVNNHLNNYRAMQNKARRDFLKKSLLGISGAALMPGMLKASGYANPLVPFFPELPTRVLGRTGIKSPLISMGSGGSTSPNFVRAAYDAGIKLFFSATYYGEGKNEQIVGEGLKGLPRDSFVISTAAPMDGFDNRTGVFTKEFNPDEYIKKAEGSLQRFGLDYVDIFMVPGVCQREHVMFEPMLNALLKLKEQGKTKFLGVATHDVCHDALIAAADAKIFDTFMITYNYKVEDKEGLHTAIKYAADAGIGIIAMKTTAGAFHDKDRTSPLNTDAALKWVLQNENISTIVSGMSTIEEMQKNLSMIQNLKMTEQELKDLNLAGLNSEPSLFCHQCKKCIPQCRQNLNIPTLMRSYMYAYGYRDLEHAQHTLFEAGLDGRPCDACDVCNVKCTAGFDVKDKIQDIARLKDVPGDFLRA